MNSRELQILENDLGLEKMEVTQEQMQAAYALNLCSVSVSQIIDYNDINVLEQEYDAILNNLNLENIPKDEALLDIIKRLLETITFFRIQDGEKEFVEREYQHKMKNAIWSAIPNPVVLLAAGVSTGIIGTTVSLAASLGTAYMNYRKNQTEYHLEKDNKYWALKKTAMEQFQTLQQQLFETSWRLADKYMFPDMLRLSERQIKQYNAILMDEDEVRKFERLDSIKHKFAAYPPFWYYFGNTANNIASSTHYGLNEKDKEKYKNHACMCFEYFYTVNKYDLLREDIITASCYLEYIDLLDIKKDISKIEDLIIRAVKAAGNSLDVLQLCAIAYLKIGKMREAAYILRQLVNEQYNEITNAQLLSTIYVNDYIISRNDESKTAHNLLEMRINPEYLFPFPDNVTCFKQDELQANFIKTQKRILKTKYKLVLIKFMKKYEIMINKIIPLPNESKGILPKEIYADKKAAREERCMQVKLILGNEKKRDDYISSIQMIPYSIEVLEILNNMFKSVCLLECVQEQHKQLRLQQIIEKGIKDNKLGEIDESILNFDEQVYEKIQNITLGKITHDFFIELAKEMADSVENKTEMNDFAIAEYNLIKFCKSEDFDEPEVLFAHKDDVDIEQTITTYFTPELIGNSAISHNERIQKNKKMIDDINKNIKGIVCSDEIEFYTNEDARISQYFYENNMQKYAKIRIKTLAVLNDKSRSDMDLLFTTEGIMPIIRGKGKTITPYSEIKWNKNSKKKELKITVKYSSDKINMGNLYKLINELAENEEIQERNTII